MRPEEIELRRIEFNEIVDEVEIIEPEEEKKITRREFNKIVDLVKNAAIWQHYSDNKDETIVNMQNQLDKVKQELASLRPNDKNTRQEIDKTNHAGEIYRLTEKKHELEKDILKLRDVSSTCDKKQQEMLALMKSHLPKETELAANNDLKSDLRVVYDYSETESGEPNVIYNAIGMVNIVFQELFGIQTPYEIQTPQRKEALSLISTRLNDLDRNARKPSSGLFHGGRVIVKKKLFSRLQEKLSENPSELSTWLLGKQISDVLATLTKKEQEILYKGKNSESKIVLDKLMALAEDEKSSLDKPYSEELEQQPPELQQLFAY